MNRVEKERKLNDEALLEELRRRITPVAKSFHDLEEILEDVDIHVRRLANGEACLEVTYDGTAGKRAGVSWQAKDLIEGN